MQIPPTLRPSADGTFRPAGVMMTQAKTRAGQSAILAIALR
jgi:hypothetical protein